MNDHLTIRGKGLFCFHRKESVDKLYRKISAMNKNDMHFGSCLPFYLSKQKGNGELYIHKNVHNIS